MLSPEWIKSQFEGLDIDTKPSNDSVMIRCPFHGEGMERTPSCRVNMEESTGYPVGFFHCYACGETGKFKALADKLGIKFDEDPDDSFHLLTSRASHDKLLEEEKRTIDPLYKHFPIWPITTEFRGISGKILNRLKARRFFTDFGEEAYIPVTFLNEEVGGIKAKLKASYGPSYIYTPGPWVKRYLFPYDYVTKMLKVKERKKKKKVVFISEGTRDALNPIQYGLPALMNLGGKTTWSPIKAEYIESLDADLIVLAFDDDEIGKAVTKMAYNDLSKLGVNVMDLDWQSIQKILTKKEKENMTKDGRLKMDMGALPKRIIKMLKTKLET